MVSESEDLVGVLALLKQLGGGLSFGDEDDSVLADDAQGGPCVVDGLEGVLDLADLAL